MAIPKLRQMDLACPIWRYPFGSGGNRVATRPSFLFAFKSSATISRIKSVGGAESVLVIFAALFSRFLHLLYCSPSPFRGFLSPIVGIIPINSAPLSIKHFNTFYTRGEGGEEGEEGQMDVSYARRPSTTSALNGHLKAKNKSYPSRSNFPFDRNG
jgi:hypothetical protein